jgi:hypothetical protein
VCFVAGHAKFGVKLPQFYPSLASAGGGAHGLVRRDRYRRTRQSQGSPELCRTWPKSSWLQNGGRKDGILIDLADFRAPVPLNAGSGTVGYLVRPVACWDNSVGDMSPVPSDAGLQGEEASPKFRRREVLPIALSGSQ